MARALTGFINTERTLSGRVKTCLILGTRPQIVKSAPIIYELRKYEDIELSIIHTGQHYDYQMSRIFFDDLDLPDPDFNVGVGSGAHGGQTGRMLMGIEKALLILKPDVVLVPGDTNSALAGALAAVKLHTPVCHVEAGARSYDMGMPEEVNRRLADHCSSLLFAPSRICSENLLKEGIHPKHIHLVGDSMFDLLLMSLEKIRQHNVLDRLGLKSNDYCLVTVHRAENVDSPVNLERVLTALLSLRSIEVVFPMHPRVKRNIDRFGLGSIWRPRRGINTVEPVGYHAMQKLVSEARFVITDSGGLQKEAFWLRVPCITLRDKTEWVETVAAGANTLVGLDMGKITNAVRRVLSGTLSRRLSRLGNPYGKGDASRKLVSILRRHAFA